MEKHSPEKWGSHTRQYKPWWENLTIDEKVKAKKNFEELAEKNKTNKRNPYPAMYDLKHIRVGQLSDKQIYRIWVFKDRTKDTL